MMSGSERSTAPDSMPVEEVNIPKMILLVKEEEKQAARDDKILIEEEKNLSPEVLDLNKTVFIDDEISRTDSVIGRCETDLLDASPKRESEF